MGVDAWLPEYDEAEQHEIVVAASVDDTWRTLRSTDFARSPVVRVLLGIRGLGTAAADLNSMVERGFTLLEEHSPHEITLGMVGRPHRSSIDRVAAEEFRAYAVPGSVRIVWDFTVEAVGEGSRIRTITRIQATDEAGLKSFRRYWPFIRPFSGLTRIAMLRLVKRRAEGDAVRL